VGIKIETNSNSIQIRQYVLWKARFSNTPFALRDFVGVSDIESLGAYVKIQWRDYEDRLLGKSF